MTAMTSPERRRVGILPLPVLVGPEMGAWEYHRAIALSVLYATITSMALAWGAIFLVMQAVWDFHLVAEIGVAFGVSAIMALQAWIFYRYCNLRLSANLLAYSYFVMTLVLVMLSGGFDSPLTIFLFCCVVITFRISEKTDGIMNAFFVLLAGMALAVMKRLEIETPNLLQGLDRAAIFAIVWIVTLVIFAACLATYHHQQHESLPESR